MNWPLASNPFTIFDRLKVAAFVVNSRNQLTMGPKVEELERKMSDEYGAPCLATSSGSTSNHLIFEVLKQCSPYKEKPIVICPAVTWVSSISPAIMAGYEVEFCDINLHDFCFDYDALEVVLQKHVKRNIIIWPTALIGFCPDFSKLKSLARKYSATLILDSCENQFSTYKSQSILAQTRMTSTSCYWSHQMVSIEMGFVFFQNQEDYFAAKMLRNHGLTRSLPKSHPIRTKIEKQNKNIDPQFLFGSLGTNWRPTDMHAIWGLQEFKRIKKYKEHRREMYNHFTNELINENARSYKEKFFTTRINDDDAPFCLPVFLRDATYIEDIKQNLNYNGIETRPIIGGNLLFQPPFKEYAMETKTPNANFVHNHGFYVGLRHNLKKTEISKLVRLLS